MRRQCVSPQSTKMFRSCGIHLVFSLVIANGHRVLHASRGSGTSNGRPPNCCVLCTTVLCQSARILGSTVCVIQKSAIVGLSESFHFCIGLPTFASKIHQRHYRKTWFDRGKMGEMGNFSHTNAIFLRIFVPFPLNCTHFSQRCILVVSCAVPFFYSPFFRVVLGTAWSYSIACKAIEVPRLKTHSWCIFVTKNHCDHLK